MLYVSLHWKTPVKTICNDSLEGRHPDDPANGASVPHSRVKTQQPHVFINIRLRSCPHLIHHCVWVFALTFFQLCFLLWPWSGVCCCNVLGRFLHHIISSFFLRLTFFASLLNHVITKRMMMNPITDSSVLSASSMFARNVYKLIFRQSVSWFYPNEISKMALSVHVIMHAKVKSI